MKLNLVMIAIVLIAQNMVSLTLNALDFDVKNIQLMEVSFSESESTDPKISWQDRKVNFAYKYEAVSEIVKKIMVISGKEVIGLEPLSERRPSMVAMKGGKAFKTVTILLKCEGFKIIETEKYFEVIEDKSIDRNACLY